MARLLSRMWQYIAVRSVFRVSIIRILHVNEVLIEVLIERGEEEATADRGGECVRVFDMRSCPITNSCNTET